MVFKPKKKNKVPDIPRKEEVDEDDEVSEDSEEEIEDEEEDEFEEEEEEEEEEPPKPKKKKIVKPKIVPKEKSEQPMVTPQEILDIGEKEQNLPLFAYLE